MNHRETTRRRITIYEDPRDDFNNNPQNGYFQDDNFMARSEISRRMDYGPEVRTPLRLRYRGA